MSDDQQPRINLDESVTYNIRIKGHLGHDWADWFANTSLSQTEDGETILTCTVEDQSALHGLLRRLRDLGIPLISVVQVEADNPKQ